MQGTELLSAVDEQLSADVSATVWLNGPQQHQTDAVNSWLSLQTAGPAGTAGTAGTAGSKQAQLIQSIAALHHLPATAHPASATVLSCIRTLSALLDFMSAVTSLPNCMRHVPNGVASEVLASLYSMRQLVHGYAWPKGRALLGVLQRQLPEAASKAQQTEQDNQCAKLLHIVQTWQVSCVHILPCSVTPCPRPRGLCIVLYVFVAGQEKGNYSLMFTYDPLMH